MKKTTLAGCAIFVIGLVIAAFSFGAMGFDFTKLTTRPPYEEKTFVSASAPTAFSLQEQSSSITLGVSPDDKIHIRYYENDKEKYEIADEGGALRMKKVNHYKWYDYLLVFNAWSPSTEILLPENFSGDVDIQNDNGPISAVTLSAGNLSLTSDNGDIDAANVKAQGEMTVESSNGHLMLSQITALGPAELTSKNGWVRLEDATAQSVSAKTGNGAVDLIRVAVKEDCLAKSSNGHVAVDELDAGRQITLSNSNGAIYGSIVGKTVDFTIDAKTSNGSCNLPEALTGGQKQLSAKTGNGDIDITFTLD